MNKRVGVIMGGPSAEREVSLRTGQGVLAALLSRGYDAVGIDWTGAAHDLWAALRQERVEVAFIALHGTFGEDGCVQGLLECCAIPYTGSGVLASALAMDKVYSRRIFDQEGIESPRWCTYRGAADVARIGLPLVVKPAREGSSVGVSIVHSEAELPAALERAGSLHGPVLLEEYVRGREIQVAVLDGEALGEVEVRPATEFYDYEAKYLRNDTQYLVPAPLTDAERHLVLDLARRAHRALGCHGATRTDLILTPSGRAVCLEVNTLPGLTEKSLLPKIAAARGIDYATLIERILATASLKT
ncbi:MAG: D-alanine--D-alanine ligase [Myxococcales bacterium]|nr:D-alanine--D-alanine ligase [Myxococcota bacterium]MDW8280514.1 D-alanine--D-alanine ligase [Myxococcales bacterium]